MYFVTFVDVGVELGRFLFIPSAGEGQSDDGEEKSESQSVFHFEVVDE